MPRSLPGALLGLSLVACSSDVNHLVEGTYTCKKGPLSGAQVSFDNTKTSVRIAAPGAAPVRRTGKPWDRSRWPTLCPRGMTDTSSEVIDLGAEPLALGSVKIDHPVLVANCLKKPALELRSLGADGKVGPFNPDLEFER